MQDNNSLKFHIILTLSHSLTYVHILRVSEYYITREKKNVEKSTSDLCCRTGELFKLFAHSPCNQCTSYC